MQTARTLAAAVEGSPEPIWKGRFWPRAVDSPWSEGRLPPRRRSWPVGTQPSDTEVAVLLAAYPERRETILSWRETASRPGSRPFRVRHSRPSARPEFEIHVLKTASSFEEACARGNIHEARVLSERIEFACAAYSARRPTEAERMMADAEFVLAMAHGQPGVDVTADSRGFTAAPDGEAEFCAALAGGATAPDNRHLGHLLADMAASGIRTVEIRRSLSALLQPMPLSPLFPPSGYHSETLDIEGTGSPEACHARFMTACSPSLTGGGGPFEVFPVSAVEAVQRFIVWQGAILASYAPGTTARTVRLSHEVTVPAVGAARYQDAVDGGVVISDRALSGRLARYARSLAGSGSLRHAPIMLLDIAVPTGERHSPRVTAAAPLERDRPLSAPFETMFRSLRRRSLMLGVPSVENTDEAADHWVDDPYFDARPDDDSVQSRAPSFRGRRHMPQRPDGPHAVPDDAASMIAADEGIRATLRALNYEPEG